MAAAPRRHAAFHRRPKGWTPEMDAALRTFHAAGLGYAGIVDAMAEMGLGRRSPDAAKQRAFLLGLARDADDAPLDCRRGDGADPLLAALSAAHETPPADTRPPRGDGHPLDWRRLQPVAGAAGSPAALCAELGARKQW